MLPYYTKRKIYNERNNKVKYFTTFLEIKKHSKNKYHKYMLQNIKFTS